jgi:uncharacterized lipoprotein YmbA
MSINGIKVFIIFWLAGCSAKQGRETYQQEIQRRADVAAEAKIDSAYAAMKVECDSLLANKVPLMADSIIREMEMADSLKRIKP